MPSQCGEMIASSSSVAFCFENTAGPSASPRTTIAKSEIHRIIRQLAKEGLAVLMISSDLPEVLGMSDRVAVMRGGKLVEIISKENADAHTVMGAALGTNERDVA